MWGALHGGGLAAERLLEPWIGGQPASPLARVVSVLVVFHFVCLAWIFFRAEDFTMASLSCAGVVAGVDSLPQQAGPLMVGLIALGLAGQFLPERLFERTAE